MLYPKEIRNYRDWTTIDVDLWRQYLVRHGESRRPGATLLVGRAVDDFGPAYRGDIDKHLAAFEDAAPALAQSAGGARRGRSKFGRTLARYSRRCSLACRRKRR